ITKNIYQGLNELNFIHSCLFLYQLNFLFIVGDKLILTRPASGVSPEPVAAPRKRKVKPSGSNTKNRPSTNSGQSSQEEAPYRTASVQDAPLIKFDSSESEPTDSENFDPLVTKSSAERPRTPSGSEWPGSTVDQSLGSAADKSMSREGSAQDLFDPLSDLADLSFSDSAQMSKAVSSGKTGQFVRSDPLSSRRDSSDLLMHEWSLSSLSRSHMSMPRATQPLKTSYPNNPFILGRFQTPSALSSPSKAGNLHNLGQTPYLGSYIGHKVSDFHKTSQLRQPFRPSSSILPPPRHLSPASLAPYTRPTSPMTLQSSGTLHAATSTSSLNSPSSSAQHSTTGPSSGSNKMSSMSFSSETHVQNKPDFFSDLLDIDFGSRQVTSPEPQHELISGDLKQSSWETFE
ncbi:unnamed protein product, partial [Candidula unifasciata]